MSRNSPLPLTFAIFTITTTWTATQFTQAVKDDECQDFCDFHRSKFTQSDTAGYYLDCNVFSSSGSRDLHYCDYMCRQCDCNCPQVKIFPQVKILGGQSCKYYCDYHRYTFTGGWVEGYYLDCNRFSDRKDRDFCRDTICSQCNCNCPPCDTSSCEPGGSPPPQTAPTTTPIATTTTAPSSTNTPISTTTGSTVRDCDQQCQKLKTAAGSEADSKDLSCDILSTPEEQQACREDCRLCPKNICNANLDKAYHCNGKKEEKKKKKKSKSDKETIILVVVIVMVIFLTFLIACVFTLAWYHKRRRINKQRAEAPNDEEEAVKEKEREREREKEKEKRHHHYRRHQPNAERVLKMDESEIAASEVSSAVPDEDPDMLMPSLFSSFQGSEMDLPPDSFTVLDEGHEEDELVGRKKKKKRRGRNEKKDSSDH